MKILFKERGTPKGTKPDWLPTRLFVLTLLTCFSLGNPFRWTEPDGATFSWMPFSLKPFSYPFHWQLCMLTSHSPELVLENYVSLAFFFGQFQSCIYCTPGASLSWQSFLCRWCLCYFVLECLSLCSLVRFGKQRTLMNTCRFVIGLAQARTCQTYADIP